MRLAELSYFKTGGSTKQLEEPTNLEELCSIRREIQHQGDRYFFLGGGTNSLVWDDPFLGTVISCRRLSFIQKMTDTAYKVGAGVTNTQFSEFCLKNNLEGTSWMYGLPGQIGATTRMNARCYGGEISEIVSEVHAVDSKGNQVVIFGKDAFRGYKDTVFMTEDLCIGSVVIQLRPSSNAQAIHEHMQHCMSDRLSKNQFKFPSCGCVFKNDYSVGVPSGFLLDKAGVKNLSVGDAKINPFHANFIFNTGNASCRDIFELSVLMREKVYDLFGVWLEYEMELLGDIPQDVESYFRQKRNTTVATQELDRLKTEWQKKSVLL